MIAALALGTGAATSAAHPYSLWVDGRDVIAAVPWQSISVTTSAATGTRGSLRFTIADPLNAIVGSISNDAEVVFWDHTNDVPVFGGFVIGIRKTSSYATGLRAEIDVTDYGVLLDEAFVTGFTPGADGAAVGTLVQSLVANHAALTALGNVGDGIQSALGLTVEVNDTDAVVADVPTITKQSLRDAITDVYNLAVTAGGVAVSTTTSTRTMPVSADALIATTGALNLGAGADLHLPVSGGYGGYDIRSLVKFALTWTDVTQIVSAKLYLKQSDQAHLVFGSSPRMYVERITGTWTEGTAKASTEGGSGWSSSNAVVWPGPATTTTGRVDTSSTLNRTENRWVNIDITDIVEAWAPATVLKRDGTAGGAASNYGVMLKSINEAATTNDTEFYARESSGDPYLVLTYRTATAGSGVTSEAAESLLLYVDAQKRLYSYRSSTHDGTAPYVVSTAPVDSQVAPVEITWDLSLDRYVTRAYVVGSVAAATGMVGQPAGRVRIESYEDTTNITTAAARDAAGQRFLAERAAVPTVTVTVAGYDGWVAGSLLTVKDTVLFGAEEQAFKIVTVRTSWQSATFRVYELGLQRIEQERLGYRVQRQLARKLNS